MSDDRSHAEIPTREERAELRRKLNLRGTDWERACTILCASIPRLLDAIDALEQQNESLKGALISAKGIISCMEQRLAEAGRGWQEEAGAAEKDAEEKRMKDEKEILQWSKQIIDMRREARESVISSEERIQELEQQIAIMERMKAIQTRTHSDQAWMDRVAELEQRLAAAEAAYTVRLEKALQMIVKSSMGVPDSFGCDGLGYCNLSDCQCSNHIARRALDAARKEGKP